MPSNDSTANKSSDALIDELRSLRKGAGLSSWKLEASPLVMQSIDAHAGGGVGRLKVTDAYDYLVSTLESLGDSVEARATRNAFGLGDSASVRRLSDRRAGFAGRIGRHADTVEIYENRGIAELASRLITGPPVVEYRKQSVKKTAADNAARLMVAQGLDALFDLDGRSEGLLGYFDSGRTTFLDTVIELRLTDSARGKDWFSLSVRYVFSARMDSFRLGVTKQSHHTDTLMASGLVDEVVQFFEKVDLPSNADSLVAKSQLSMFDETDQLWKKMPLVQVSREEHQKAAQALWQIPSDSFLIYECLPPAASAPGRIARYEYTQVSDFLATYPQYAFWYAPKMMHINSLLVDVSQFHPKPDPTFRIRPHLGMLMPETYESTDTRLSMSARGWIMPGNGVWILCT